MEQNHSHDRAARGRTPLAIPQRGQQPVSTPVYSASDTKPADIPKDLAAERQRLGFDDIPVGDEDDMDAVRFRDIFHAWGKQAVRDSPLEHNLKKARAKTSRLKTMKNNLKWALQADLDEPVKPQPKPQATPQVDTAIQPRQKADSKDKTIDITINFDSLPKLPKIPRPHLVSRRAVASWCNKYLFTKLTAGILGVAIITGGGLFAWSISNQYGLTGTAVTRSDSDGDAKAPTYRTLLPNDKSIAELGGWRRVSPPGSTPVYAYMDKIDGTLISVSQQPLPDTFKKATDKEVASLAEGFHATDKLDAGDTKAYLGTSAKGPQSVIFTKSDLLVLIKSEKQINNDTWITYIKSLISGDQVPKY